MRITASFIAIALFFKSFATQADASLQPHRAYYTLSMVGRPDLSSLLSDVRGTMMIEFNKEPDGWTVQQLSETWHYSEDEAVEHIRSGYATWESEDGSLFKFNTFRKVDDELVEDIRGIARKTGKLCEAIYQKPETKTIPLPENVLFPAHFLQELLKTANQGEHILSQVVFEGNSMRGASEMNTFIGAKKILDKKSLSKSSHQFASQAFWPVRISVYGLGKAGYNPDSVTTQDMLPNGIITQYVIDDGTVKIRGVLERVELLK